MVQRIPSRPMARPSLAVLIIMGVLLLLACSWLLMAHFRGLAYTAPASKRPRPMFTEWRRGTRGSGWGMVYEYRNDRGLGVRADATLNIVVVVATVGEQAGARGASVAVDHAVLEEGTPYEVTIQKTANVLVWVDLNGRRDLRIDEGVARETLEELRRESRQVGGKLDVLDTLLRKYRGPDNAELEKLVDDYCARAGPARAGP